MRAGSEKSAFNSVAAGMPRFWTPPTRLEYEDISHLNVLTASDGNSDFVWLDSPIIHRPSIKIDVHGAPWAYSLGFERLRINPQTGMRMHVDHPLLMLLEANARTSLNKIHLYRNSEDTSPSKDSWGSTLDAEESGALDILIRILCDGYKEFFPLLHAHEDVRVRTLLNFILSYYKHRIAPADRAAVSVRWGACSRDIIKTNNNPFKLWSRS